MGFLGPVTTLQGHLVRPHDLEVETHPFGAAVAGHVERLTRIGFEVRLDVSVAGEPVPVLVTLTRADAARKALAEGSDVWILPVPGASRVAITGQVPLAAEDDLAAPAR
nr:TOBE-like domain-containing protein [Microlunatus antarcticus]